MPPITTTTAGAAISSLTGGGGGGLGTLILRLVADSAHLVSGMAKAETSIITGSARITASAVKMGAAVTSIFTGLGIVAVREFAKFESSFAGVRKTVDATEAEFKSLQNAFRQMAKEIPTNVNEINKVGEAAGQLGIKKDHILGFTRTMLDLGETTNLTSDQAATQLARLANITGMPQTQFDKLGSTVVDLGNKFATTEAEIVDMGLRIAGAGTQVGMTEPQILALATAMSSLGIQSELGGSAMTQVISRMSKAVMQGGEDLETFAQLSRMSSEEFSQTFADNAGNAVIALTKGIKSLTSEGKDVFTMLNNMGVDGVRVTDVLLRLANSQGLLTSAFNVGNEAWRENRALTEEAQKRYETFASQIKITMNLVRDIFIEIGGALAPHLLKLNTVLQESLKDSDKWKASIQGFADSVVPAVIVGIGYVMDAIQGLRIMLKTGETWFSVLASFATRVFSTMATAFEKFWETIINGVVSGLNKVATLANKVLPAAAQIPTMDFQLDIPAEGLRLYADALAETRTETGRELAGMLKDTESFGEKLLAKYQALPTEIKKKALDPLRDMTAAVPKKMIEVSGLQANRDAAMIDSMFEKDMPGFTRGRGGRKRFTGLLGPGLGGFEDPVANQLSQLGVEKDATQEALKKLEEVNQRSLQMSEETNNKKIALLEAYNAKIKALHQAEAMIIFNTSSQMFDDLASVAETFAGRQSGLFKGMFAASKAFAIAESIVKIQQGIANAAAQPWPLNLAAIASVVSATANIVSTISSVSLEFGGERQRGGPVSPGSAFLVGEKGPELFVPSDMGNIIPNNRLSDLGSQPMKVVVNNYTDARAEVRERQEGNERVLEVLVKRVKNEIGSEIRDGRGTVTKAMESTFNLARGRGQ